MSVRFHPAAAEELREAEWYIEERRPGWGSRFRDRVEEAIQYALSKPGNCVQSYGPDFCSVRVLRFRYRIYHRWLDEVMVVHAVYHDSRKEQGWEGRTVEP